MTASDQTDNQTQIPDWDIAIANLARDTHREKGRGLKLIDFKKLAADYNIRLDDIMITMFQLVIHGEWRYTGKDGEQERITQETLDSLYVNRRLTELDLQDFTGSWQPAGQAG